MLNWPIIESPPHYPKQADSSFCGVFIVYYAEYLSLSLAPSFLQGDVPLLRMRTILFFKRKELASPLKYVNEADPPVSELMHTEKRKIPFWIKTCPPCNTKAGSAKRKCDVCGFLFRRAPNRTSPPQFMSRKRMSEDNANHTMLENSGKSKSYPCLTCGKSYSHSSGLSRHKRYKHSSVVPIFHMCEHCFIFIERKDNLDAHIRNVHSKRKKA